MTVIGEPERLSYNTGESQELERRHAWLSPANPSEIAQLALPRVPSEKVSLRDVVGEFPQLALARYPLAVPAAGAR